MLRKFAFAVALVVTLHALVTTVAFAEMSDEDYVSHAFGTVAVLHSSRQAVNPNQNWWGEIASKDLSNVGYLIGIINSRRMDKQIKPLLDPNDGSAIMLESEETDTGGYRYPISFAGMRPSEVKALVEMLGGASKLLAGATSITYEPLQRRSIYASSLGGGPITLLIGNQTIQSPAEVNFVELRGKVDRALQQLFGKSVPFDFTLSRSTFMDGSNTTDVTIYVDLNPPPPPTEEELHQEQGE